MAGDFLHIVCAIKVLGQKSAVSAGTRSHSALVVQLDAATARGSTAYCQSAVSGCATELAPSNGRPYESSIVRNTV